MMTFRLIVMGLPVFEELVSEIAGVGKFGDQLKVLIEISNS